MTLLALACLVMASIPAVLLLLNLRIYAAPPGVGSAPADGVSILIPARNEEDNMDAAIQGALASSTGPVEVLVLDDHSEDRTADRVQAWAARDLRVRLITSRPLPDGWCGKQHACWQLSGHASSPWLVFVDADVRLEPGGVDRMLEFMRRSGADLASGVPAQHVRTWAERLLIPLIQYVLLGFLPMGWMRRFRSPAFGAGCGQLFVARAASYRACEGHRGIRASRHDGLKLPRQFRLRGFRTDLFDATALASCRMYDSASAVWKGLAKNATEGLGAPATLPVFTVLWLGGSVLPWILLLAALGRPVWPAWGATALAAALVSLLPRLLCVARFGQPVSSALLHPVGVIGLLAIQYWAWICRWSGRAVEWRGRVDLPYSPGKSSLTNQTALDS